MPPAHKIGLRGFFYAAVCPSYMLTREPSIWLTTLKRQTIFDFVKKLYDSRSAAVHGAKVKSNIASAVEDSAEIIRYILLQCVINKAMPQENELVP